MGLVPYIIDHKFSDLSWERDDLISIGTIGLIKAVDGFDLSKNIKFATYATRCIINEVLLYLRKYNKWKDLYSLDYYIKYEHSVYVQDIKTRVVLNTAGPSVEEEYLYKEELYEIRKMVENLSPEEKLLIYKLYGFNNTDIVFQEEIAKEFNITQSGVSLRHKKIISKIKNKIAIYNKK